jgi:co-chaperonin GroES (HSP10)
VIFAKYAGTLIKGRDGKEFRICKDKDIAAVVEE